MRSRPMRSRSPSSRSRPSFSPTTCVRVLQPLSRRSGTRYQLGTDGRADRQLSASGWSRGASRIGRRVVNLLKPFDYTILLHDPFVQADDEICSDVELVGLD